MKIYCVAILSFFDNEIHQFIITSNSPFNAVKLALLENCNSEQKEAEIDWQNSDDYPTDLESLDDYLANGEIVFSVIKIG